MADNPRNKTYTIERIGPGSNQPIKVKADRVENDTSTGRIIFFDGDNPVASFVNINYYVGE